MSRYLVTVATDHLLLNNPAALDFSTGDFTIAGWFAVDDVSAQRALVSYGDGTPQKLISIEILTTSKLRCQLYDGTNNPFVDSTGSVSVAANWNHVAFVRNAGNILVYLDGTSDSASDTAGDISNGSQLWYMGLRVDVVGRGYVGRIQEWGWWNRALTATEITALADKVAPIMVRPDALVAYLPLMGRTSPEIDVMGNAPASVLGGTNQQFAHNPMVYPGKVQIQVPSPAAATSFIPIIGRGPGMALVGSGGLAG